jgi:hypothetical protein
MTAHLASQITLRLKRTPHRPAPAVPGKAQEPGGADRVRTDDLRLARAALSQLSYSPSCRSSPTVTPTRSPKTSGDRDESALQPVVVGLGRFELPTSRLSGVRSNQLSYRPRWPVEPADLLLRETRRFPGN